MKVVVTFTHPFDFETAAQGLCVRNYASIDEAIERINGLTPGTQSWGSVKAERDISQHSGGIFTVTFDHSKDFLLVASVLIGATYASVPDAVNRINSLSVGVSCNGKITCRVA